ncbi:unnamed protein product [Rotaria sordida]|uniref:Uncharacterized protein n=1 Tax=Rotaria sordida TaxID=392033 RepID=A0A814CR75_9BILA|nr:unnamed protein product [Rotaria sordida]CAF1019547.1 unnamed protein product [Rotaria sordida]CAF1042059.1 unnamed protein product [Rotaria sordida]CAF1130887.1 unnamed protein product [Rotaria sordida]CAF4043793.1 unnamed protein product [Rotaria sordida]
MDQELNENEVLSDNQSSSTTRPSSSTSSDMPRTNVPSRSNSFVKRQSSIIDVNDLSTSTNQQINDQTPIKVLVFNGKCSKVFKSALEDCVEDCILEFPNERNSVYVPKFGQAIQIPPGSNRNTILSLREQYINARQSARSSRRRSSINQHNSLPQINNIRSALPNNLSLPATALAATTAVRMRHQLVQQKFSLEDNISEETIDQHINIQPTPRTNLIESDIRSEHPSNLREESICPILEHDITSLSLPTFFHNVISSSKTHRSYRDHQKGYRLSDLVMLGPEYFRHVFNLPRSRSHSQQRHHNKTIETTTELDRIKQDLFHRYLWTQKPQVSCRIRPLSTYTRDTTFVI